MKPCSWISLKFISIPPVPAASQGLHIRRRPQSILQNPSSFASLSGGSAPSGSSGHGSSYWRDEKGKNSSDRFHFDSNPLHTPSKSSTPKSYPSAFSADSSPQNSDAQDRQSRPDRQAGHSVRYPSSFGMDRQKDREDRQPKKYPSSFIHEEKEERKAALGSSGESADFDDLFENQSDQKAVKPSLITPFTPENKYPASFSENSDSSKRDPSADASSRLKTVDALQANDSRRPGEEEASETIAAFEESDPFSDRSSNPADFPSFHPEGKDSPEHSKKTPSLSEQTARKEETAQSEEQKFEQLPSLGSYFSKMESMAAREENDLNSPSEPGDSAGSQAEQPDQKESSPSKPPEANDSSDALPALARAGGRRWQKASLTDTASNQDENSDGDVFAADQNKKYEPDRKQENEPKDNESDPQTESVPSSVYGAFSFPDLLQSDQTAVIPIGQKPAQDSKNPADKKTVNFALRAKEWYLRHVNLGVALKISDTPFVIGSSCKGCDYVISFDPNLSRRHASLVVKDGQVIVSDLMSTNQTFIDYTLITKPAPLYAGQILRLGVNQLFMLEVCSKEEDAS